MFNCNNAANFSSASSSSASSEGVDNTSTMSHNIINNYNGNWNGDFCGVQGDIIQNIHSGDECRSSSREHQVEGADHSHSHVRANRTNKSGKKDRNNTSNSNNGKSNAVPKSKTHKKDDKKSRQSTQNLHRLPRSRGTASTLSKGRRFDDARDSQYDACANSAIRTTADGLLGVQRDVDPLSARSSSGEHHEEGDVARLVRRCSAWKNRYRTSRLQRQQRNRNHNWKSTATPKSKPVGKQKNSTKGTGRTVANDYNSKNAQGMESLTHSRGAMRKRFPTPYRDTQPRKRQRLQRPSNTLDSMFG